MPLFERYSEHMSFKKKEKGQKSLESLTFISGLSEKTCRKSLHNTVLLILIPCPHLFLEPLSLLPPESLLNQTVILCLMHFNYKTDDKFAGMSHTQSWNPKLSIINTMESMYTKIKVSEDVPQFLASLKSMLLRSVQGQSQFEIHS